jgi:hypothetical protein
VNWRRSSGEIINATLLEIFLSFIFVVLTVAWFRTDELEAMRAQVQADSVERARRDSIESERRRIAERQRDSIMALYNSQFPPLCREEYVLTVTLNTPANWDVEVHVSEYGFTVGQHLRVAPAAFETTFRAFRQYAYGAGQCRFRIRLVDTPALDKEEFKYARGIVERSFYVAAR